MRTQKRTVHLTDEQTKELKHYIRSGKQNARNITRARILIMCSENKIDTEICNTLKVCPATVYNTRKRFREEGLLATLQGYSSPGKQSKLDGKAEAAMVAIACSQAPAGHNNWTMQLIADKMIELSIVETISDETVRRHLKKTKLSHGRRSNGASEK
jgi:transposase